MFSGLGGNPYFQTGQIAVSTVVAQIPYDLENTGLDAMRLHVCATVDVFFGDSSETASTGFRVPANTPYWFTTRAPMYAIAGGAGTLTYMLESAS